MALPLPVLSAAAAAAVHLEIGAKRSHSLGSRDSQEEKEAEGISDPKKKVIRTDNQKKGDNR